MGLTPGAVRFEPHTPSFQPPRKGPRGREPRQVGTDQEGAPNAQAWTQRMDYYGTLGVSRNASEVEVKAAFRKQAVLWHPDKHNQADDRARRQAATKFKELSEAYRVLSDPKKRAAYDRGGRTYAQAGTTTYRNTKQRTHRTEQYTPGRNRGSWKFRFRNFDKVDALFHLALVGGAVFGFTVLGGVGDSMWEWWNDGKLFHHMEAGKTKTLPKKEKAQE